MKNSGMKIVSMLGVALALWVGSPVAQGDLTLSGLECYLDFTVPPIPADPGPDPNNPDPNSVPMVIDLTGNGNNGSVINGPDPDGAGPVTGVPEFNGAGLRFHGGWIDVDVTGSINTLGSGTIEIIIDGMPITDNSISTGSPLSIANTGNTGRDNDFEIWLNHRYQPGTARHHFNGRAGAVEQFETNYINFMQNTDGAQREQYFVQWDGGTDLARLVGRHQRDGALVVDSTPWVGMGTMPDFLSAAINLRLGARNNGNAAMEAPHYFSEMNILRVYDRVLTDQEMSDNWDAYNTQIPDPTTCQEVIVLGHGLASDLTGDCYVNLEDFGQLAIDWMRCVEPNDGGCEKPWENF
jgi:hypothetical protein